MLAQNNSSKYVLLIDLLAGLVNDFLSSEGRKQTLYPDPRVLRLVEYEQCRDDDAFAERELIAQLLGTYHFVRVA